MSGVVEEGGGDGLGSSSGALLPPAIRTVHASDLPPVAQTIGQQHEQQQQSTPLDSAPPAAPGGVATAAAVEVTSSSKSVSLPPTSTAANPPPSTAGGHHRSSNSTEGGAGRKGSAEHMSLWKNRKVEMHAYSKDIWALGLTIVIGGQYFAWNMGLTSGTGSYFIATFLMATGYLTLCLCLAEMTSAMPFAGGAYGFARVTLGTYAGFIVGCCESLEYIAYVSAAALGLGQMVTIMTALPVSYEPIWWAVFFITALGVLVLGGRYFWRLNLVCAILITLIPILYCFMVIPQLDGRRMAWPLEHSGESITSRYFRGGLTQFMEVFPLTSWFFVGCEALPLAAEEVHEAKTNLPKGIVACVVTLFITCFGLFFTVVCGLDGVEGASKLLLPLNDGFAMALGGLPPDLMTALTLPSAWATGMGFIFTGGRQMFAMARSGLFPSFMTKTRGASGVPYMAFLVSSLISLVILILAWLIPAVALALFQICIASAYATYLTQLYSYVTLLQHYPTLQRAFKSPLGAAGAYWSIAVFFLGLVASLAFQPNAWITPTVLFTYIGGCSLYYWLYARHHQIISPEEEAVMFIAYVVRNNMMKAARRKGKVVRGSAGPPPPPNPNRRASAARPESSSSAAPGGKGASAAAGSAGGSGRKSSVAMAFGQFSEQLRSGQASSMSGWGSTPASPSSSASAVLSPRSLLASPRSGGSSAKAPLWLVIVYNVLSLAFTRYRVVVDVAPEQDAARSSAADEESAAPGPPSPSSSLAASGGAPPGGEDGAFLDPVSSLPSLTGTVRIVPDRGTVNEMIKKWFGKKRRNGAKVAGAAT